MVGFERAMKETKMQMTDGVLLACECLDMKSQLEATLISDGSQSMLRVADFFNRRIPQARFRMW
jgi:hypothetical protein